MKSPLIGWHFSLEDLGRPPDYPARLRVNAPLLTTQDWIDGRHAARVL